MRIYSMTATFGKLEGDTLTFEPGLNVIHAPNEWGKSTWCAFLLAMLYGVETRSHSTKAALADKERYAPWSGKPMSGSIRLDWAGRDITIERTTKGRIPMGEFRAFETQSGLSVPELTGENCGQVLLGVEKSVFRQAGFIRLRDMPVAGDDSLRRRLNALVTTGDESGTGEQLQQGLRELKNRCRANKSKGLLPQALEEARAAEESLKQFRLLQRQELQLRRRESELSRYQAALLTHKQMLAYRQSRENQQRLEKAKEAMQAASRRESELSFACAGIMTPAELAQKQQTLDALRRRQEEASSRLRELAGRNVPTGIPGMPTPEEAGRDEKRYKGLLTAFWILLALGLALTGAGVAVALILAEPWRWAGFGGVGLGTLLLLLGVIQLVRRGTLKRKYKAAQPGTWLRAAEESQQALQAGAAHKASLAAVEAELGLLEEERKTLTGGASLSEYEALLKKQRQQWQALEEARRAHYSARELVRSLQSAAVQVDMPEAADSLTFDEQETQAQLAECTRQMLQLHRQLGSCQAQMEALGSEQQLKETLDKAQSRVRKLEMMLEAIELAQRTLQEASEQLQRRFAPRIAKRTRELFARLTADRYDRIALDEELRLRAAGAGEDALRPILFRSEGTVDQLYLALRLAVAEELTPGAPLVLDDALARFDDARTKEAVAMLAEEAKRGQVILFTCHSREADLI